MPREARFEMMEASLDFESAWRLMAVYNLTLAQRCLSAIFVVVVGALTLANGEAKTERPNVILIVTDDQGFGDFGSTGNPQFETPHLDTLAARSSSFSTFYVSPLCAPTRASVMTGRYNYRTGVVDTYLGRSLISPDEVTVAEALASAGYATGIFGKWHLGDNYPRRPIDQGFEEALTIRGGGLAQPSDPLENKGRYTNPILFRKGVQTESTGYCTDLFFDAAIDFIQQSHAKKRSFFAYIATNTPHHPFNDVPPALLARYRKKDMTGLLTRPLTGAQLAGEQDDLARIGAMVTNIDDNVGRLTEKLKTLGIDRDTLLIFLVDNGPNTQRFVGGLRGIKGSVYEGGVRSPLWLYWPGHLAAGQVCDNVGAHIDLMPTILDACGLKLPQGVTIDGRSLLLPLRDKNCVWPAREIVIQTHRADKPQRYENFMIRDARWKLLNASSIYGDPADAKREFELYDMHKDPGEKDNVAEANPEIVARLKAKYDTWFDDVTRCYSANYRLPRIQVGTSHENPAVLTRQCWRGGGWEPDAIGHWDLQVMSAGSYNIKLLFDAKHVPETASLQFGNTEKRMPVPPESTTCTFSDLKLTPGDIQIEPTLKSSTHIRGVYQMVVERKP
jgi:arylsulfatase A-like enzyme